MQQPLATVIRLFENILDEAESAIHNVVALFPITIGEFNAKGLTSSGKHCNR